MMVENGKQQSNKLITTNYKAGDAESGIAPRC